MWSTISGMTNMSPIPVFAIALEIQAGRIPVQWTAHDVPIHELRDVDGKVLTRAGTERVFVPKVKTTKWGDTELSDIDEPLDLRARLFKAFNTNWSEKSVLAVLEHVGAWKIGPGGVGQVADGTYANIAYRHRLAINVRVLPVTLDEVRGDVEYWYRS